MGLQEYFIMKYMNLVLVIFNWGNLFHFLTTAKFYNLALIEQTCILQLCTVTLFEQ